MFMKKSEEVRISCVLYFTHKDPVVSCVLSKNAYSFSILLSFSLLFFFLFFKKSIFVVSPTLSHA